MSKLKQLIIFCSTLIAILVSTSCGGSGNSTAPGSSAATFYVYATNAGGSVTGLSADATSGTLSPISGSPFIGPPSSQAAATTPDGHFLFVSSLKNNTVNGFSIDPTTGALAALPCFGGYTDLQPMNIAINQLGTHLYVQNQQGTISAFSIDTGCLTPISGSPFRTGTIARGLAIDRTDTYLYAINETGVNVFSINPNGSLVQRNVFPFSSTLVSVQTSPVSDLVFVGDKGTTNQIFVFSIFIDTGDLISVNSSPISTNNVSPMALALDPAGKFLFVGSKEDQSISVYSVGSGGSTAAVAGSPFTAGLGASSLTVDASGSYLFVANNGGMNVQSFKIGTSGSISPINSVTTPTTPIAVVSIPAKKTR
jgi:6-phosphogluconolactonase (cycloisomerase 2 family)